jgi:hypothetical protein
MAAPKAELFILYQMGSSEDWTWFSVVGVFLTEAGLRAHAREKGIAPDLELLQPSQMNEVVLREPRDFVAVRSSEGEVPDVELDVSG